MRIRRAEIRLISIPLKHPFETSFGREEVKRALILSLSTGEVEGWSECVASAEPRYGSETISSCLELSRNVLIPILLKRRFRDPPELVREVGWIRGNNMAKAFVEMALWDVYSKSVGRPLSDVLGGVRDRVPVGVSIGIQRSVGELIDRVGRFVEEGYRRIKVKIKPGWDVEVVRAIRDAYPDIPLMVDANASYTLGDIDVFRALDGEGLMMIEQPLGYDDIYMHSLLRMFIETPICLDESVSSPSRALEAYLAGSMDIINVKPGRVGGHTASVKIHNLGLRLGIPLWVGGMLETGIGRAHNVALASLPGFTLPGDISASDRYFDRDVVEPEFRLNRDGTLTVPRGPGIGVEVNVDMLDRLTVKRWVMGG